MAQEIKPIKRSSQLAPLSREHHDGLLFAWKIKQGLDNKTPLDKLRKYSLWYWQQHIKPHFSRKKNTDALYASGPPDGKTTKGRA
ncbi:MAG: hypothetical protein IPK57_02320 [Chitinophagaceae bacterium]|nr:hypothetical protein [Chitinophagaceae bacterium]